MRSALVLCVLALAGCGSSSSGGTAAPVSSAPYDRDASVARAVASLGADGYDVDEGKVVFFQVSDCATLPDCYGNNPSSPYGLYQLPPAPGQAPITGVPAFGVDGQPAAWRLREDEAVVFVGRTSPRARYLSFRSYLFQRGGKALFASLGDSLNHLVLATDASDGQDAFGRETVVITTADAAVEQDVRAHLASAGVPAGIVNTDVLPSDELHLGLDDASDALMMLYRVALIADAQAGADYFAKPPARLLRVRPRTQRAASPIAPAPLRPRGDTDESAWTDSVKALGDALEKKWPAAMSHGFVDLGLDGATCISTASSCLGDNRDTRYDAMLPTLLGDGDRIVVYGVNHTAIGKMTYTNLSVYLVAKQLGVGSVADDALAGSAAAYFPAGDPAGKALYAYSFARHCDGDPYCLEVPVEFPGVPLDQQLVVVVRPYLEPSTKTGPDKGEVLLPKALRIAGP